MGRGIQCGAVNMIHTYIRMYVHSRTKVSSPIISVCYSLRISENGRQNAKHVQVWETSLF